MKQSHAANRNQPRLDTKSEQPGAVSRRRALFAIGAGLFAAPLLQACATMALGDGGDHGDAGNTNSNDASATGDATGSAGSWASGGTAAMTAQASYPDPFASLAGACTLVCATTAGPCTTPTTIERQDVSEGYPGLPLRLALQIVDESCNPIAGAKVEIWHTQRTGIYSGPTPNPGMCSNNDATAIAAMYFRGSQTTDANGRVNFDSCFPGWYSSRAIHIHFRVTIGGSEYVVSQLFFSEDLISEIFGTHPDYSPFGQPDTHLSNDNVIGGVADKTPYILETARMSDGAMLASKRIAVRSSLGTALCMAGR